MSQTSPGGIQAFDYDTVFMGQKTPVDNTYGEDSFKPDKIEGMTPCLLRFEVEHATNVTAADEELFHLSDASGSAIQDLADSTCLAKCRSGKVSGAVSSPDQNILTYVPPALIPMTKDTYYIGYHTQGTNVVQWRVHVAYRFIKSLQPAQKTQGVRAQF